MSNRTAIYLLALGLVFLIVGAVIILNVLLRPRRFVKTEARIIRLGTGETDNSIEAIVEFTVDGETVRARCQDVSHRLYSGKVGDQVTVYYSLKKLLGARTAVVYLEPNGSAASRYNALIALAGAAFAAAGVVMIVFSRII